MKDEKSGDTTIKTEQNIEEEKQVREMAQNRLNEVCDLLAENVEHRNAIMNGTLDGYYSRLCTKLIAQKKNVCDQKRKAYSEIRKNRNAEIEKYSKIGIDTSELEKERNTIISRLLNAIKDENPEGIDLANKDLFEITQKINNAKENADAYYSDMYKRNVEKAKQQYYDARDTFKSVKGTEKRQQLINEFKEAPVDIDDVNLLIDGNLREIQTLMNKLYPPAPPFEFEEVKEVETKGKAKSKGK